MSVHELTIKALRTQPELFSSGKYVRNDKKSVRKGTPLRTRHSKTAMQLKQCFQIKNQSIFTVSKHYYPITTTSFCPCAKVPSRTAFIRRRGGKMKKRYPGVSAEHIRCTPEDIVHLPDMNEDEIKQLLRQSVPALQ